MATTAQIKLQISKLTTSAIEKKIEEGKYTVEELEIAKQIVENRSAAKGKAESEKSKGRAPKKATKPAKVEAEADSAETKEAAPAEEKPAKVAKEKKVKEPKVPKEPKAPKEPKPKKEPKARKEGHGNIRAEIKVLLLQFVAPAEVRKQVKEKLGLEREVHYSEVKSVLDRLKADKETGEQFSKAWEEKFKKEPAAPKEKVAKEKKKKEVVEEEVSEPTVEELAQLAATEAEDATSNGEEQVSEAA